MRWAVVAHPDQFIKGRLVQTPRAIPEDSLPIAIGQGWIVLASDTDLVPAVNVEPNLQSNPSRIVDHGEQ